MNDTRDRTPALLMTLAAIVLCGMPGLISACLGLLFMAISRIPGAKIDIFGRSDPHAALLTGLGFFLAGALVTLVPVAIGIVAFRRPPG